MIIQPVSAPTAGAVLPTLSILVVNWNKSSLTEACLSAVNEHTGPVGFEIIVVDNGSDRDDVAALKRICTRHNAMCLALRENLFFGEANNIAAEAAKGKYMLLLNNDVTVTRGYLAPLLAAFESGFQVGAVGPRFLYPDGRLQEAGGYIRPDGWSVQHGKTDRPNPLIAGPGLHIVDYCSAACLLLQRDTFLNFGGFDPLFDPAYFEDVDLSLRLRSAGLFTYYCGDVAVIHEENTTARSLWAEKQAARVVSEGHRKFVGRWGAYLAQRIEEDLEPPRFPPVGWGPPQPDPARPAVGLHVDEIVCDTAMWTSLLRLIAKMNTAYHVKLYPREVCSRSRLNVLSNRLGLHGLDCSLHNEDKEDNNNHGDLTVDKRSRLENPAIFLGEPAHLELRTLIESLDFITFLAP